MKRRKERDEAVEKEDALARLMAENGGVLPDIDEASRAVPSTIAADEDMLF